MRRRDRRHGIGCRAQADIPDDQRCRRRRLARTQPLAQARLLDVQTARLFSRLVDGVHGLSGGAIANAPDIVAHNDLVAAAFHLGRAALRIGDVPRRFAITVAGIEHVALRVIELEPRALEYVPSHGAHQLQIEMNVVGA